MVYIRGRSERRAALERWLDRREIIRATRLRGRREPMRIIGFHGALCPWHCVCNDTHVFGRFCPRCEWTTVPGVFRA